MDALTAEQKIRKQLAGSPMSEPYFNHEGPDVVRWITGGSLPDLHVTFHPDGERTAWKCATCHNIIGYVPVEGETVNIANQIAAMRLSGHDH